MIGFIITALVLLIAAATYTYLDWSIWQILGVMFVVLVAFKMDERGPKWRKALWAVLAFSLMVLAHFVVSDNSIYWGELLLGALLLFAAIASLLGVMNHKPGDGSTLTVYFLGFILLTPLSGLFLYNGLEGLGYLVNLNY